uniref:Uncharacterized protein n=1 Tax=Avena sativa TaxID=4498 RepID=A0ACD5X1T7_AVESA
MGLVGRGGSGGGFGRTSATAGSGAVGKRGLRAAGAWGIGALESRWSPTACPFFLARPGDPPASLACGGAHTLFLTQSGRVFATGLNDFGQLGTGSSMTHTLSTVWIFLFEYTPRLIKNLDGIKIKRIAAGMLHSACIDEKGTVFIFGQKTEKVFGRSNDVPRPSVVEEIQFLEEVSCGGYHTCVVTDHGDLYSWGSNENGCLGLGVTGMVLSPEVLRSSLFKLPVCKVSCGWKHTAVISGEDIYTWGWGGANGTFFEEGHSSGGQLGHGNDVDYFEPMMVEFGKNARAVHVSCGFNHTGAILEYKEN